MPTVTPVPIPSPRVRSQAETLRIQKYVPAEVTLTESLGFPMLDHGKSAGIRNIRKDTKVKVVKVSSDKLVLEYDGSTQTAPISSTDFLERVITEAQK